MSHKKLQTLFKFNVRSNDRKITAYIVPALKHTFNLFQELVYQNDGADNDNCGLHTSLPHTDGDDHDALAH